MNIFSIYEISSSTSNFCSQPEKVGFIHSAIDICINIPENSNFPDASYQYVVENGKNELIKFI